MKSLKNRKIILITVILLLIIAIEGVILFILQQQNWIDQIKIINYNTSFLAQSQSGVTQLIDAKTEVHYRGVIKKLSLSNNGSTIEISLGDSVDPNKLIIPFHLSTEALSVEGEFEEKIDYQKLKVGDNIDMFLSFDYREFLFHCVIKKTGK